MSRRRETIRSEFTKAKAGITRRRVLILLGEAGIETQETTLTDADLHAADEILSVGNYSKVVPCTRYESRALNAGPIFAELWGARDREKIW